MDGVKKLTETMRALRDPQTGCPWDLKQDHHSLMPYFHEELNEFEEALLENGIDNADTQEELGDLFFQIVFHAQLLEEKGLSSLNQLAENCANKLIRRHPHVFQKDPNTPALSAEEVRENWEKQKKKERSESESRHPITDHVAKVSQNLNAVLRAQRLGDRAASFGFDWKAAEDVVNKVKEEFNEFLEESDPELKQEELGDLFFSLAQYARKKNWNLDQIIKKSNLKFINRFKKMELAIIEENLNPNQLTESQWEQFWQKAKASLAL